MGAEKTTRREFVKISLAAGVLGATAAMAGCAQDGSASQAARSTGAHLEDISWDGVFDVVVVGFGAAGASSALAAADSGSSVVLLDKAPEGCEGGNSRYATQLFVTVDDPDRALAYYQDLRGGFYAPDEVLKAYVDGLSSIRETLAASVDSFNAAAQSGFDALGRKADSMRALGSGPLYAVEVVPSVMATRGGPERTAGAEVVGADGNPVGHLYAAGELGGITSFKYQGGDGLSECIVFGRIAGEGAARAKEDALDVSSQGLELVPGCGDVSAYSQQPDESGLADGWLFGVADGLGGPLWVKVKGSGGALEEAEIVRHSEHPEIGAPALEALVSAMNESRLKDIDGVSGATVTSRALKKAIENALRG